MQSTPWRDVIRSLIRRILSGQRRAKTVTRLCRHLALLIPVALAGLPPATPAATTTKLQIDGVQVDTTAKTIIILGQQFTAGGAVSVTLGEFGDITASCHTPVAPTATVITCTLTTTFPHAGDYRLTVSTGTAASQIDTYDLTIGAVGPPGPTGATGPAGPAGVIGPTVTVNCEMQDSDLCNCPELAPKLLTGGASCNLTGSPSDLAWLNASLPLVGQTPEGWIASCVKVDGTPTTVRIIVVCYTP
jgi:hypothetical protein